MKKKINDTSNSFTNCSFYALAHYLLYRHDCNKTSPLPLSQLTSTYLLKQFTSAPKKYNVENRWRHRQCGRKVQKVLEQHLYCNPLHQKWFYKKNNCQWFNIHKLYLRNEISIIMQWKTPKGFKFNVWFMNKKSPWNCLLMFMEIILYLYANLLLHFHL